jgi:hypothetical protein
LKAEEGPKGWPKQGRRPRAMREEGRGVKVLKLANEEGRGRGFVKGKEGRGLRRKGREEGIKEGRELNLQGGP